jgi:hypothetical protein
VNELENKTWAPVFICQVKRNSPVLRALLSLGPECLCFLRYLLSSAEFRMITASVGAARAHDPQHPVATALELVVDGHDLDAMGAAELRD